MTPSSRRLMFAAAALALGARLAAAAAPAHPPALDTYRPAFLQDSRREAFRSAVSATVRANLKVGSKMIDVLETIADIFVTDARKFWKFLSTRVTLSPKLEDNAFIVAHKEAFIVGPRADAPFDLDWAIPEELKAPEVWRAAVADLPPASLRGNRAEPQPGVTFIGWPPKAL